MVQDDIIGYCDYCNMPIYKNQEIKTLKIDFSVYRLHDICYDNFIMSEEYRCMFRHVSMESRRQNMLYRSRYTFTSD
jgi:hypothetical protein